MRIPSLSPLSKLAHVLAACLLVGSLATTFTTQAQTATIEGIAPLSEVPPSPAVMAKRYEIVSRGGVLSTIPPVGVVWLEGIRNETPTPGEATMTQRDYLFHPALLPVQKGTRVHFPNEDEEYHNVFSYSPAERFDLGRYMPEERPVPSQLFDQAGMITIRCDIHEHMRAIILVLDSPHFVMTDPAGRFRLEGLPPGEYVLKAWLDSARTLERPVVLEADKTLEIDFADP